jgi:hypothetical protein
MIAALVLAAMYLVPIRYSSVMSVMITWALFVNAMFAGHALFMRALPRYGEPMVPLLPLLGAFGLIWLSQLGRFLLPAAQRYVISSLWSVIKLLGDIRRELWSACRRFY